MTDSAPNREELIDALTARVKGSETGVTSPPAALVTSSKKLLAALSAMDPSHVIGVTRTEKEAVYTNLTTGEELGKIPVSWAERSKDSQVDNSLPPRP